MLIFFPIWGSFPSVDRLSFFGPFGQLPYIGYCLLKTCITHLDYLGLCRYYPIFFGSTSTGSKVSAISKG
jgi:hypothetical protein